MQNDILKLADKSVIIAGPFSSYTFDVVSSLSRLGASIVLLTPDEASSQRICQVINDEREIKEDYGKAFTVPFNPDKDAPDKVMAEAAHTFRGLDVYIDNMNWYDSPKDKSTAEISQRRNFELSKEFANSALAFLKSRKKGKIIFLADGTGLDKKYGPLYAKARGQIFELVQNLGLEHRKLNININALVMELTEDFLLKHFPGQPFKESLATLKKEEPTIDMTRTEVISKFITAMACDLSQGATGQTIKLNV